MAFAGFTLAAALSGLYVWQERRLKRREAGMQSEKSVEVYRRIGTALKFVSEPPKTRWVAWASHDPHKGFPPSRC